VIRPHQWVTATGLGFLLGVLVASRFGLPWVTVVIGLVLLGVVFGLSPRPAIKLGTLCGIFLLLGWWRYDAVAVLPNNNVSRWAGQTVEMVGTAVSDPDFNGTQQNFQLRINSVNSQPAVGEVLLTTWQLPRYQYGDRLKFTGKITLPEITDDFDYPAYLAKEGVYALAQSQAEISVIGSRHFYLLRGLYQIKHWLEGKINQLLPEPQSSLMDGLLLGMRIQLPDDFKTALRNSGTTHIVALSGYNITVVVGFFLWMMKHLRRRWALLGAGIGVLLFVLMTGAAASVVRAAIMGWILLLTALWGRKRHMANAILLAGVFMVAINPLILQSDVGFQLSLSATIGLLYLTPLFSNLLSRWPAVLREGLSTTLSATVFTLPLVMFHFGGFSIVTLLANLLVIPLIPITMLVGFVSVAIFAVLPFMKLIGLMALAPTSLLITIINFFGHLPGAFVQVPKLSPLFPVAYYLILIIMLARLPYVKKVTA